MSFLGLVIVSTKKGPVVHEVKAGSPLEIVVFLGDRIIAVDGNDTQSMTASAVTKKMDQRRKITVLSVVTEVQNSSGLFFGDTKRLKLPRVVPFSILVLLVYNTKYKFSCLFQVVAFVK